MFSSTGHRVRTVCVLREVCVSKPRLSSEAGGRLEPRVHAASRGQLMLRLRPSTKRHLQLQTQTKAKGNAALPPRLLEVFITAVSVFLHDECVGLLWWSSAWLLHAPQQESTFGKASWKQKNPCRCRATKMKPLFAIPWGAQFTPLLVQKPGKGLPPMTPH